MSKTERGVTPNFPELEKVSPDLRWHLRFQATEFLKYAQAANLQKVNKVEELSPVTAADIPFFGITEFQNHWENLWFGNAGYFTKLSQERQEYAKAVIARAYVVAEYAHGPQYRDNGTTNYITHVLEVAKLASLAKKPYQYPQDELTIASALLHDTTEDSQDNGRTIKSEDLNNLFRDFGTHASDTITRTVDGCSKIRAIYASKEAELEATAKKLLQFLSHPENSRVAVIKLAADRIHNSSDLVEMYTQGLKLVELYEISRRENLTNEAKLELKDTKRRGDKLIEKARRKARENVIIFGPLAKMLGFEDAAHILTNKGAEVLFGSGLFQRIEQEMQEYYTLHNPQEIHTEMAIATQTGFTRYLGSLQIKVRESQVHEVIERIQQRTKKSDIRGVEVLPQDLAFVVDFIYADGYLDDENKTIGERRHRWLKERNGLFDRFISYKSKLREFKGSEEVAATTKIQRTADEEKYHQPIKIHLTTGNTFYEVTMYTEREFRTQITPLSSISSIYTTDNEILIKTAAEKIRRLGELATEMAQDNSVKFFDRLGSRLHAEYPIVLEYIDGESTKIVKDVFIPRHSYLLEALALVLTPEQVARLNYLKINGEAVENWQQLERTSELLDKVRIELGTKYTIYPDIKVKDLAKLSDISLELFGKALALRADYYANAQDLPIDAGQHRLFELERSRFLEALVMFGKDRLKSKIPGRTFGQFNISHISQKLPQGIDLDKFFIDVATGIFSEEQIEDYARVLADYWESLTRIEIHGVDSNTALPDLLNVIKGDDGLIDIKSEKIVFDSTKPTYYIYISEKAGHPLFDAMKNRLDASSYTFIVTDNYYDKVVDKK